MPAIGASTRTAAIAVACAAVAAGCASTGHPPRMSAAASAATRPVSRPAPGVRQIAVGVGSPPLTATLTLPAGRGPFPAVVLVSGTGPNDQDETAGPNAPLSDIALGLAARGIASVRYDKRIRDYPQSVDPRTFTPTREYVPDALAAIGLLRRERAIDARRIFVLGHSMGGTYAPLIAARAPEVAGVILLAAAAEPLGAALERQLRYVATLPGAIGARARAQLPQFTRIAAEIVHPAILRGLRPGTILFGGDGPAYYLSELRYHEVATARSIPQPVLLLQGDRDYQVTVRDDLDVWLRGLSGRAGVTVVRIPRADHLFLDGTGPPTPLDDITPRRVDPRVAASIASWIARVAAGAER
jgi:pimeloyl-ACP methyl ester carboxylesterase